MVRFPLTILVEVDTDLKFPPPVPKPPSEEEEKVVKSTAFEKKKKKKNPNPLRNSDSVNFINK